MTEMKMKMKNENEKNDGSGNEMKMKMKIVVQMIKMKSEMILQLLELFLHLIEEDLTLKDVNINFRLTLQRYNTCSRLIDSFPTKGSSRRIATTFNEERRNLLYQEWSIGFGQYMRRGFI